jgi:hypothetical protein
VFVDPCPGSAGQPGGGGGYSLCPTAGRRIRGKNRLPAAVAKKRYDFERAMDYIEKRTNQSKGNLWLLSPLSTTRSSSIFCHGEKAVAERAAYHQGESLGRYRHPLPVPAKSMSY